MINIIFIIISLIVFYLAYLLMIVWLAKRNRPKKGYKLKFFKFIFLGFPFDVTTALKITHNIFLILCPITLILNVVCLNNILFFNNFVRYINGICLFFFIWNTFENLIQSI